jgi:hypothetical protein
LLRSLLVEAAQIAVRFDPGMKKQLNAASAAAGSN